MLFAPADVSAIRKEAEDALRPAFDHSDVDHVEPWVQRCIDDQAQLWRKGDYWVITEVQQTKHGLVVHLVFSAGIYEPDLVTEIEDWARSIGCVRSFFSGRPGCQRRRPDYRVKYVTMEKELTCPQQSSAPSLAL